MTGDFPGLILGITNNYFSHVQPVLCGWAWHFQYGNVLCGTTNNEKSLININLPWVV